jgi:hypothetical protein
MVFVSAIHPPVILDLHSIVVIRPVPNLADVVQQKTVFILFSSSNAVRRQVTGNALLGRLPPFSELYSDMSQILPSFGMRIA